MKSIRECISQIRLRLSILRRLVKYIALSYVHGRDLELIQDNTAKLSASDLVLFCTLRNESVRIPFFLQYYRNLGVKHFFFIDNDSTDGFAKLIADFDDVSVWHTKASYKRSNFGMHWMNFLLRKFGKNRWCVVCDPDEFLVFPRMDTRGLEELLMMLDQEKQPALFCLMLDMYSDDISSAEYKPGDVPWKICPYYDPFGYTGKINSKQMELFVQGGVRGRVFYRDDPIRSPALNKIPLVKWRWHYNYISSMHALIPRAPNDVYGEQNITGCLLHFKFFSLLEEKASEELLRKQHYDNSSEYVKYSDAINDNEKIFSRGFSSEYKGWRKLSRQGLLNLGYWKL